MNKVNFLTRGLILLAALLVTSSANAEPKANLVLVNKSAARLYLQAGGKTIATFKVVFGAKPQGHKQIQGDERTPEGSYTLDRKTPTAGTINQSTFPIPTLRIANAPKVKARPRAATS